MEPHRIEEFYSLLWRAALQDRTAETAADVAKEADATRQRRSADLMWRIVRRCRVRALQLRAQAEVCRASPKDRRHG
jgi:hypothetical protein